MAEPLSSLAVPVLHVQQFDVSGYLSGSICLSNDSYCWCFKGYTWGVLSMVIAAPGEGNYSLPATLDGVIGFLKTPSDVSQFFVPSNGTNISILTFVPTPLSATPAADTIPPETMAPEARSTPVATLSLSLSANDLDHSSVLVETETLLSHLSFDSQMTVAAYENSAQGANAAMPIGVGVGLFVLILVMGGALLWFCGMRRAERDSAREPELAAALAEVSDDWEDQTHPVTCENALETEYPIMETTG
jgi:hypothetical protein